MQIREESQQVNFFRGVQIYWNAPPTGPFVRYRYQDGKLAGVKGESGRAVAVDAFAFPV
jgi:hypothetical protein